MEVSQLRCEPDILLLQLEALLKGEPDATANLANAAALLYHSLPDVSWAGFYLFKQGELVLGPFQGKVACTRIKPERGVCGTAFSQNRVLRVDNVLEFPGHIACDAESRSELVLPLRDGSGAPFGVLDLDSTRFSRFCEADEAMLCRAAALIARAVSGGSV